MTELEKSIYGKGRWQTAESPVGPPPPVGPAHVFKPGVVLELDPEEEIEDLFLRDQFAMAALEGMLAHSTRYKPREEGANWHWSIAKEAYELADAMMERRKS